MKKKYDRVRCATCLKQFAPQDEGRKIFCTSTCRTIELMLIDLFDGETPGHKGRAIVRNKIEHFYLTNEDFRINVKELHRQRSEAGTFWRSLYERLKDRPPLVAGQSYNVIDWKEANRMLKTQKTLKDICLKLGVSVDEFKRRFIDERKNIVRTKNGVKIVLQSVNELREFLRKKDVKIRNYAEKIILSEYGRRQLSTFKSKLPEQLKSKYRLNLLTCTGETSAWQEIFKAGGVELLDSCYHKLQPETSADA